MATFHNSLFLLKLLILLHSSLLLPLPILANTSSSHNFHTFHFDSLSQYGSTCKPHKHSKRSPSTLQLFHRYGPCSPLNQRHTTPPMSEILSQDNSRVQSIRAQVIRESNTDNFTDLKANLPTESGIGTGNYIVSVGLGTPAKTLSLVFDTGSDLTWTQCQPCPPGSCYKQKDPIFDPSSSSSYSTVPCNTPECSQSSGSSCAGTSCTYFIQYGDRSTTMGLVNKDTITLSTDTFPDFIFGCSQEASGLFGMTAGIIGLSRSPISIISQTAQKYNKFFSYCIPSSPDSTGHLTLGQTESSTGNVAFTPLVGSENLYYVELVGITVEGHPLSIDQAIFASSKTIIDSGTVITRLPRTVYNALSQAFQEVMTNYTRVPVGNDELLDTCYDFSNANPIFPSITFTFGGNVAVDIKPPGIYFGSSRAKMCLAFAGNSDDSSDPSIIGNTQQKTYEVVYDVAGGKLGFGEGGCE